MGITHRIHWKSCRSYKKNTIQKNNIFCQSRSSKTIILPYNFQNMGGKVEIIFNKHTTWLLAPFAHFGLPWAPGDTAVALTSHVTPKVTLQSFLGLRLSWQRRKQEEKSEYFLAFLKTIWMGRDPGRYFLWSLTAQSSISTTVSHA